jgi:hypothetical protein
MSGVRVEPAQPVRITGRMKGADGFQIELGTKAGRVFLRLPGGRAELDGDGTEEFIGLFLAACREACGERDQLAGQTREATA